MEKERKLIRDQNYWSGKMENTNYEIERLDGEGTISISELAKEVKRTCQWVGDNIEDTEIATIIITWLQKMNKKVYDNVVALEELKKKED